MDGLGGDLCVAVKHNLPHIADRENLLVAVNAGHRQGVSSPPDSRPRFHHMHCLTVAILWE